jgi:hypothetical protein
MPTRSFRNIISAPRLTSMRRDTQQEVLSWCWNPTWLPRSQVRGMLTRLCVPCPESSRNIAPGVCRRAAVCKFSIAGQWGPTGFFRRPKLRPCETQQKALLDQSAHRVQRRERRSLTISRHFVYDPLLSSCMPARFISGKISSKNCLALTLSLSRNAPVFTCVLR